MVCVADCRALFALRPRALSSARRPRASAERPFLGRPRRSSFSMVTEKLLRGEPSSAVDNLYSLPRAVPPSPAPESRSAPLLSARALPPFADAGSGPRPPALGRPSPARRAPASWAPPRGEATKPGALPATRPTVSVKRSLKRCTSIYRS